MAQFDRYPAQASPRYGSTTAAFDAGLRVYMQRVYLYMMIATAISGAAAFLVANTPLVTVFFQMTAQGIRPTGIGLVAMIAPIALVFLLSFRIAKMSVGAAQATFWIYAALTGISIASILLNFTGESVARVFFITAASFGALSLWGYTTGRDLTGMGSFLFMGLVGILLASLVNMFVGSAAVHWVTTVLGVLIFAGFTAYDTQKIKEMYYHGDGYEVTAKKAVFGALTLYLDFINLFIMLVQLFGQRSDR